MSRDAVTLQRPGAHLTRRPGGASRTYHLQPGQMHALNVRFDLDGLRDGDPVWIRFDDAFFVNGAPVAVDPIELRAGG